VPSVLQPLEVVPLQASHAPEAAALVAAQIRSLCASVPALAVEWSEEAPLARLVTELAVRGSGAVALRAGVPVGFQAATLIDGHGGRWAYTPDVGHAAVGGGRDRVVEALYAHLAAAWVREACLEHTVTVLVNEIETLGTLARLGFGQTVVDLIRDLSPVDGCRPVGEVTVRRADPADDASVAALEDGLRAHLAASPTFLRMNPPRSPELHRRVLADPGQATFIAEAAGVPIAFLRIGPSATDVATIVRGPGTASITAAFTVAGRRGDGIATCLLDAAVRWAREAGYARSAVDHESANGEAARFWARHFTPVALSMTRRLAPRLAP
jgi:GNAT superfamily N-acetyltransferase